MNPAAIVVTELAFEYPGHRALHDVSFVMLGGKMVKHSR